LLTLVYKNTDDYIVNETVFTEIIINLLCPCTIKMNLLKFLLFLTFEHIFVYRKIAILFYPLDCGSIFIYYN